MRTHGTSTRSLCEGQERNTKKIINIHNENSYDRAEENTNIYLCRCLGSPRLLCCSQVVLTVQSRSQYYVKTFNAHPVR